MSTKTTIILVGAICAAAVMASATTALGARFYVPAKGAKAGEAFTATNINNEVFTLNTREIVCTETTYKGIVPTESKTLKVVPTYKSCTFIGQPATVVNENCEYDMLEPVLTTGETFRVLVDVSNSTAGKCTLTFKATLFSFECKVFIKAENALKEPINQNLEDLLVTNLAGEAGADIDAEVKAEHYTSEGSGCVAAGIAKEGSGGTYTGDVESTKVRIK